MPIPKNREDLVVSIREQFQKLAQTLDKCGPGFGSAAVTEEWDVKQLLAIRAWWSKAVVDWVQEGKDGEIPETPGLGFSWKDTPELNNVIAAKAKRKSYKAVREDLLRQYQRVMELATALSESELFEKGVFQWTGTMPVARWLSINTARQYQTANTLIRRLLKQT